MDGGRREEIAGQGAEGGGKVAGAAAAVASAACHSRAGGIPPEEGPWVSACFPRHSQGPPGGMLAARPFPWQ